MKMLIADYLNELTAQARGSPRKRQYRNIHQSYIDPCQRLLNGIEPDSYIRPHRHADEPQDELLIAVRGSMVLMTFYEQGLLTRVECFAEDRNGEGLTVGADVPAYTWHTIIALESDKGLAAASECLNKLTESVTG